jgi:hypothetical protein
MPLQPLRFTPGIVRDVTAYTNEGGWRDCNLVRFRLGMPESFGGWEVSFSGNEYIGTVRSMFRWRTLANDELFGFGTHQKYYIELGQGFSDITPIVRSATLANPFAAATGSSIVTVTDTGHGCSAGTFVTFSNAVSLGGNITATVLNDEFEIQTIIDSNNYTIDVGVAATGSDTGDGGAAVDADYQLNAGLDTQVGGNGWGAGAWNLLAWGAGAASNVDAELRLWTQDNFGQDLVFNVRNGQIFYWSAQSGLSTRGEELQDLTADANVPTIATQVMVSDVDRHVIVFGANEDSASPQDPLLIRFSDQEDPLTWTPTSTNTAGDLRLGSGNRILKAIETKREILVWTDASLYSMQFIGPPFTFGVQQISGYVTVNGFNAFISVEDTVFWMGRDVFYRYDGRVQQMVCPVENYVFNDFNYGQRDKVYAGVNTQHSEVIWFYPSANSFENDRYVVYNYSENLWYYGQMSRTAWLDCCPAPSPLAAGIDNKFYRHEVGANNGETTPPSPLVSYVESSPVELDQGDSKMFLTRLIPDVTFDPSTNAEPSLRMTLKMQDYPGSNIDQTTASTVTRDATFPVEQYTEKVDLRLRGRSVRLRVECDTLDTRWRLGVPRVNIVPDGRR